MSDLYRLVYVSKNLLHGSDADTAPAVAQILDASRRNNDRVGVTGALMFNGGAFAQVLEGPQRGVEDTFERIQRDPRHGDVTVLQCGSVETRAFATWSMAFVGTSTRGQALWSGMAAESGFELARLNGDSVFAMLHGLVLDEEGVPEPPVEAGIAAIATRSAVSATPTWDAAQVRTEIAQLRPEHGPELPRAALSAVENEAPREPTAAASAVLRAALASERQRTSELRGEVDALQIVLATSHDEQDRLRGERDLWASREAARLGALP